MLSKNAVTLLNTRYTNKEKGEQAGEVYPRAARFLSNGEEKFEKRLNTMMANNVFLPNSPCLMNAGDNKGGLHACYILPVADDLTEIMRTVADMAKIFQESGGVGINFSPLRPEGASLSRGGTSSGPISFMKGFDIFVEIVKQGGRRRGALMGIMNWNHPDIYNFINAKVKGELKNFNLSIMASDEFMRQALTPLTEENNIFTIACNASWINGDPAFLFLDRINKDNPFSDEFIIDTVNPCSEVALPHYSACCLGSLNLSTYADTHGSFNFEGFYNDCAFATKVLTRMNELGNYPLPQIAESMRRYNPVGVGIMGFADCLVKLSIRYDSPECLDFIDKIGKVYMDGTLSYEPDRFFFYRRIIAPTGSLSLLADCSSGIEPIYAESVTRNLVVGKFEEIRKLYKSEFVRTAHQVSPEWHVKVLAQWQKWIDGGCSKTVNLPKGAKIWEIQNVYKMAWEMGCKGITVYRDGSHTDQPLNNNTETETVPYVPFMGKCSNAECTT